MPDSKLFRKQNKLYRSREYLTPDEISRLLQAAELRGRHPLRDKALFLLMYRHGLRVSEAIRLQWQVVMFQTQQIYLSRLKGSKPSTHPLQDDEVELLQALRTRYPGRAYLFPAERAEHLSAPAVTMLLKRCAELAELDIKVHPHMLRHSCGYYLVNKGYDLRKIQDWLGHRNIQHTVRYTELDSKKFELFVFE